MALRILPPQSVLREWFDYDPEIGQLIRKARPREHFPDLRSWHGRNTRDAGTAAASLGGDGYLRVGFLGKYYRVHRLIWKWMTGEDPPAIIDHVNRNRTDNRWCNLRAADPVQSRRNSPQNNNRYGFKGVGRDTSGGSFWIRLSGFKTYEEAQSVHPEGKCYVNSKSGHYYITIRGFKTPEEAYSEYCRIASTVYGPFFSPG